MGQKITNFDPNWAFLDCKPSLTSPMDLKWCTNLDDAQKMCHIVFQGHASSFKVMRLKKSSIWTQIGRFWTVTPFWINWWIWNDAQSLTLYRRRALSLFEVIHQISSSHGLKNCQFESNSGLLGRSQLSNPSDLPCYPFFRISSLLIKLIMKGSY